MDNRFWGEAMQKESKDMMLTDNWKKKASSVLLIDAFFKEQKTMIDQTRKKDFSNTASINNEIARRWWFWSSGKRCYTRISHLFEKLQSSERSNAMK